MLTELLKLILPDKLDFLADIIDGCLDTVQNAKDGWTDTDGEELSEDIQKILIQIHQIPVADAKVLSAAAGVIAKLIAQAPRRKKKFGNLFLKKIK